MSHDLPCIQAQADEIEALLSIYGDSWKSDENVPGSYAIDIIVNKITVSLFLQLSSSYPLHAPPIYTLSAPNLSTSQKHAIANLLDEEYLRNVGESVLYQWIEKIRDFLTALDNPDHNKETCKEGSQETNSIIDESVYSTLNIIHGDVITDRKSAFQGHLARVTSVQQVQEIVKCLKSNRKISNATHNIFAYRILIGESSFAQDCEDDGETQAGGRLLHLLQIVDVSNVVVVVSRWYGGIHLGPDRFRHINNAARQVLQAANLLSPSKRPT